MVNQTTGGRVMHEIELVEQYTAYLTKNGVEFYEDGFPKFKPEWIITCKPKVIAPFNKRQYYWQSKQDISICYFGKDEHLYPRLDKVFEEIKILREYHSVCMMDISISPLMLDEVQRMNLLINLLYSCVLAVNDIKIIPSFRTGDFETMKLLCRSIGHSNYWVMGAIGTQQTRNNSFYEYLFRTKCMYITPKHLLCYGHPNKQTAKCLEEYGIGFKPIYKDFRSLSYLSEIKYYE